jgi:hypothetical protein
MEHFIIEEHPGFNPLPYTRSKPVFHTLNDDIFLNSEDQFQQNLKTIYQYTLQNPNNEDSNNILSYSHTQESNTDQLIPTTKPPIMMNQATTIYPKPAYKCTKTQCIGLASLIKHNCIDASQLRAASLGSNRSNRDSAYRASTSHRKINGIIRNRNCNFALSTMPKKKIQVVKAAVKSKVFDANIISIQPSCESISLSYRVNNANSFKELRSRSICAPFRHCYGVGSNLLSSNFSNYKQKKNAMLNPTLISSFVFSRFTFEALNSRLSGQAFPTHRLYSRKSSKNI